MGVVVLILTLYPTCSGAAMLSSGKVMQPQWIRSDTTIKEIFKPPRIYLGRDLTASESLENYMTGLVLDESWEEWMSFQRSPYRVIPIEALKRIFRVASVSTKVKQSRGGSPGPEEVVDVAGSIILPGGVTWVTSKHGMIHHAGGDSRKFSPFEWLIQEEGLFSGRPWDWENFLPRLLTIGGLVVLGLLVTEGLHALFGLGAKVMGLRNRQDNTEAG